MTRLPRRGEAGQVWHMWRMWRKYLRAVRVAQGASAWLLVWARGVALRGFHLEQKVSGERPRLEVEFSAPHQGHDSVIRGADTERYESSCALRYLLLDWTSTVDCRTASTDVPFPGGLWEE
jgi:hypothetical protein